MLNIFRNGYQLHVQGPTNFKDINIVIRMYPMFSPGGKQVTKITTPQNLQRTLIELGEIAKENAIKLPEQLTLI